MCCEGRPPAGGRRPGAARGETGRVARAIRPGCLLSGRAEWHPVLVADTSTWTLTHITFDTDREKWRLKVERITPPIDDNERFFALGSTFAEALADAEAEIRRRAT